MRCASSPSGGLRTVRTNGNALAVVGRGLGSVGWEIPEFVISWLLEVAVARGSASAYRW